MTAPSESLMMPLSVAVLAAKIWADMPKMRTARTVLIKNFKSNLPWVVNALVIAQ
jgi:hypothetical protein